MYDIFLDDERFPAYESDVPVVVCRNVRRFQQVIRRDGFPRQIHFDHDLGEGPNGVDAVKWLIEYTLDYCIFFEPPVMEFYIHSQNPVGAYNIHQLLDNFTRHLEVLRNANRSDV